MHQSATTSTNQSQSTIVSESEDGQPCATQLHGAPRGRFRGVDGELQMELEPGELLLVHWQAGMS
jgi:hypothetical protein